jgi:alginate lyase/heparinase II/III-like protein
MNEIRTSLAACAVMLGVSSQARAGAGAFTKLRDNFDAAPVWKVVWGRADPGFRVENGRLVASDDGGKHGYALILSRHSYKHFVMQWTQVRLADHKNEERAQIVVGMGGKPRANAKHVLWLKPTSFQVNQPYAMRLVVVAGRATLYRRRVHVPEESVVLEQDVPPEGRVGFQHYNRYGYAYDDLSITSFGDKASARPARASAFVCAGGTVRLEWSVPRELAQVFQYRILRARSADMADASLVDQTRATRLTDTGAPPQSTLFYRIVALTPAGDPAAGSRVLKVQTGSVGTPGSVGRVVACPRRAGGVTVRWDTLQGQPVEHYTLRRRTGKQAKLIGTRPHKAVPAMWFVDPKGQAGDSYGVAAVNVLGRPGRTTWVVAREPAPLEFVGQELRRLLGAESTTPWRPPPVRKVDPAKTSLRAHPRLVYTQEQIDQAKQRIRRHAWAKRRLELIRARADQRMSVPLEKNDRTFAQAAAFALTGEASYAKKVRDTLLYWADRYRKSPLRHGEARLSSWQHGDSMKLIHRFVQPYDLIYNSRALSSADRRHIEQDLLRPMADDLMVNRRGDKSMFHTVHNFHAMRLCAVGLVGFCLDEPKYIRWAVTGPHGFLEFLSAAFNDDGFWWEKTISYHVTTGQPCLYMLAEAATNNNLDLWNTPVPDTCLTDYGARYPVDGDNGPKTLRLAFDALLYFMFPNRKAATFGDSVWMTWRGGGWYHLAERRYRQPRYAWFNRGAEQVFFSAAASHWQLLMWWDGTRRKDASFRIGSGRFANSGVARNGSTLFPSTGYAVLCQDETDPDAPALAFTYGPFGGGHNHGDRLAYLLYARQTLPIFHTSTYHQGQPGYAQYRASSIAYNTVVADATSHRTSDSSTNPNTGRLDFFHADPLLQAVGTHADVCYPDVFMRRALLLGPDCLVDIFICRSPNTHTYDYILHVDTDPAEARLPAAAKGMKLGVGNGYQDVDVLARAPWDKDYTAVWPFPTPRGSARLGFRLLAMPGTEIIAGAGPGCMKHKPLRRTFIARRQARDTVFVSVTEIFDKNPTITAVEPIELSTSAGEGVRVSLKLSRGPVTDVVVYNERAGRLRFADTDLKGHAAWLRRKAGAVVRSSVVQPYSLNR